MIWIWIHHCSWEPRELGGIVTVLTHLELCVKTNMPRKISRQSTRYSHQRFCCAQTILFFPYTWCIYVLSILSKSHMHKCSMWNSEYVGWVSLVCILNVCNDMFCGSWNIIAYRRLGNASLCSSPTSAYFALYLCTLHRISLCLLCKECLNQISLSFMESHIVSEMEGIPEVEQMLMWCTDFLIVIVLYFIPKNYKRTVPKNFLYKQRLFVKV